MTQKILTISVAGDLHSRAVNWALRACGCEVSEWTVTDFPAHQTAAVMLDEEGQQIEIADAVGRLEQHEYHTVWLRRFWKSHLPAHLHPADRAAAAQQVDTLRRSLLRLLAPQAFWVNPPEVLHSAGHKPVQLSLARSLGLTVPKTLIGNDPQAVREFYRACGGKIIYKPLESMVWLKGDRKRVTYTTPLTEQDLADEAAIQLCPAIFQENIDKAYEIRATFMGAACMAVKLDTQSGGDVAQDWRHGVAQGQSLKPVPIELPQAIYQRCREFMRRMGIVYGAFDFIVTPENDYIFLEVNHGGQFIWVEMENPECPVLEMFTRFLMSADPDFTWAGKPDPALSMAAWQASEDYRGYQRDPDQGHQPYNYEFNREAGEAESRVAAKG